MTASGRGSIGSSTRAKVPTVSAATSRVAPPQSMRPLRFTSLPRVSRQPARRMGSVIGRFAQNTQRQSARSVISPPHSGPRSAPASEAAAMAPRPSARLDGGSSSTTIAMATGTTPPAPTAWMARATIEPLEGRGEGDERATGHEYRERGDDDAAAPVHIRDAAEERQRDEVAEQVAVDDPRGAVEVVDGDAYVLDDRGQHGDNRGLVIGGDEDAKGDDHEEPERAVAYEPRRGRASVGVRDASGAGQSRCPRRSGSVSTAAQGPRIHLVPPGRAARRGARADLSTPTQATVGTLRPGAGSPGSSVRSPESRVVSTR